MIEHVVRAKLLWNNGNLRTTEDLDDKMSAPDMELIVSCYDVLMKGDTDKLAHAVNRGIWGDKDGSR